MRLDGSYGRKKRRVLVLCWPSEDSMKMIGKGMIVWVDLDCVGGCVM